MIFGPHNTAHGVYSSWLCSVCGTLLNLKSSSGALEDAWMNEELMTLAQGNMNNYLNPLFQPIGDASSFLYRGSFFLDLG